MCLCVGRSFEVGFHKCIKIAIKYTLGIISLVFCARIFHKGIWVKYVITNLTAPVCRLPRLELSDRRGVLLKL